MSTWKRLLTLFLAAMMILPVFSGCKKGEESGKGSAKASTENVEKYFLYTEAEKLYCLDATTGKSTPIGLDFAVDAVENGLVCDDSTKMVARVKKLGQEISGLIYWDGRSEKASYLGDNTDLVRVSKDGNYIWYEVDPSEAGPLYCYDTKEQIPQKIVDRFTGAAVSDDGKSAFVTAATDLLGRNTLFYCKVGAQPQQIAQISYNYVSASQDRSTIGYIKYDEQETSQESAPVYLWTKSGGEKTLPFEAISLEVFAADEIYYRTFDSARERYCYYYYDGDSSHLLTENGLSDSQKAGNELFYYADRTNDTFTGHFVYKGKDLETPIQFSTRKGYSGFYDAENKSFYGWSAKGITTQQGFYRVQIDGTGKPQLTFLHESDGYSPRYDRFYGGCLLERKEDGLYLNGNKLVDSTQIEDMQISQTADFVVYMDPEGIFGYADGEHTAYPKAPDTNAIYPARGRRILSAVIGGRITLHYTEGGTQKLKTIGEKADSLCSVYTWSSTDIGLGLCISEMSGTWFNRYYDAFAW